MLKRIRRALLWVKVLSRAYQNEYSFALDLMTRMATLASLRPYEEAFRATLLLRNGSVDEAERELERIVLMLAGETDPNKIYTRLFCENLLAALDGDLDRKRSTRKAALSIDCSAGLKDWLPL